DSDHRRADARLARAARLDGVGVARVPRRAGVARNRARRGRGRPRSRDEARGDRAGRRASGRVGAGNARDLTQLPPRRARRARRCFGGARIDPRAPPRPWVRSRVHRRRAAGDCGRHPSSRPMKLVMTLRARDEADVLESQLAFHQAAGVDFFVAIDHRSSDGRTEILERYAKAGHLHLIRDDNEEMREGEWATRMARLAATDFGADWVISSDADEFWWPRGESLKDVLASIPERYGVVRALLRHFVPRPDGDASFAERLTARMSGQAPINDPTSLFRPNLKSVNRGDPEVRLAAGAHTLIDSQLVPLRGWYPIELLHFPIRSSEQF